MPVTLNGETYRLAYLDTNVISEASKRDGSIRRTLLQFPGQGVLPCYSVHSVLEIMESELLFGQFVDCFAILPSAMLASHEYLLDLEIQAFKSGSRPDIVMISPWGIHRTTVDPRQAFRNALEAAGLRARRDELRSERETTLQGIIDHSAKIRAKQRFANDDDVREWVNFSSLPHLARVRPAFVRPLLDRKAIDENFDFDRFASIKMIGYVLYHKFYTDGRKPKASDVMDLVIATTIPYADIVYVEKHLAEVVRKTQQIDPFVAHLQLGTLKDLREVEPAVNDVT